MSVAEFRIHLCPCPHVTSESDSVMFMDSANPSASTKGPLAWAFYTSQHLVHLYRWCMCSFQALYIELPSAGEAFVACLGQLSSQKLDVGRSRVPALTRRNRCFCDVAGRCTIAICPGEKRAVMIFSHATRSAMRCQDQDSPSMTPPVFINLI